MEFLTEDIFFIRTLYYINMQEKDKIFFQS